MKVVWLEDRGVVDEERQRPKRRASVVDERGHYSHVGEIGSDNLRPRALGLQGAPEGMRLLWLGETDARETG